MTTMRDLLAETNADCSPSNLSHQLELHHRVRVFKGCPTMHATSPYSYHVESSFRTLELIRLVGESNSAGLPEAVHVPAHPPRPTHTPPRNTSRAESTSKPKRLFYTPRTLNLHLTQH